MTDFKTKSWFISVHRLSELDEKYQKRSIRYRIQLDIKSPVQVVSLLLMQCIEVTNHHFTMSLIRENYPWKTQQMAQFRDHVKLFWGCIPPPPSQKKKNNRCAYL